MSATGDIVQSYRAPRMVMRRHLSGGANEARVLVFLLLACCMIFISQWPALSRAAYLDASISLEARIVGALFGWIFLAPLGFYALAALSHLAARAFGGQGSMYGARLALFWSLLVIAPIWLLHGLVAGFVGAGPAVNMVGVVLLAAFGWVWLSSLIEAQARPKDW